MEGKKVKELKYLIAIPVGVFLFCVFFEIINDFYWQKKLDSSLSKYFTEALNVESIDTKEEYVDYINEKLTDEKYENINISFSLLEKNENGDDTVIDANSVEVISKDYKIQISVRIEHFSVTGYFKNSTKFTNSCYIGYLDDYNEPVVEKVKDSGEEDDRVYTDEEEANLTSTTSAVTA